MKEIFTKGLFSSSITSSILVGVGVLWAGQMLAPLVRQVVRPAAVKGAQGAIALSEQTSGVLEKARNELSRIIEEAKSSKEMAYAGAGGMLGMGLADRSSEVDELKAKIAALENQLKERQEGKIE